MNEKKLKKATFAGGCFWCMQSLFDQIPGVVSTTVGYTGGFKPHPTYKEVCAEITGHAEAVEVWYDSTRISYAELLDVFWRNIDPTTMDRQFVDAGSQYRTVVFYHTEKQEKLADASKRKIDASGRFKSRVVTDILPAQPFYQAEAYHQGYYRKNPVQYHYYRTASGRDRYLNTVWQTGGQRVPVV